MGLRRPRYVHFALAALVIAMLAVFYLCVHVGRDLDQVLLAGFEPVQSGPSWRRKGYHCLVVVEAAGQVTWYPREPRPPGEESGTIEWRIDRRAPAVAVAVAMDPFEMFEFHRIEGERGDLAFSAPGLGAQRRLVSKGMECVIAKHEGEYACNGTMVQYSAGGKSQGARRTHTSKAVFALSTPDLPSAIELVFARLDQYQFDRASLTVPVIEGELADALLKRLSHVLKLISERGGSLRGVFVGMSSQGDQKGVVFHDIVFPRDRPEGE